MITVFIFYYAILVDRGQTNYNDLIVSQNDQDINLKMILYAKITALELYSIELLKNNPKNKEFLNELQKVSENVLLVYLTGFLSFFQ